MKVDILSFSSLFNWWWLPTFGTRVLLSFCYSSGLVAKPPVDAVHRRNSHFQLARVVVIVATLAYQFLSSVSSAAPNYYQLLALPLDVDADGVKRSFRALARRYHPDKVGPQGEAFFIVLRKAHDALSDPVKRFAYDRFGPQITEWKDCQTPRDFMVKGLTGLVAFYTVNPAMYALLGYLNSRSDSVSFWRLACLFALLALELAILVSPDYPAWLAILMPNTTIHDFLQLAHRFFVDFFFASLQLSSALDVIEYGDEAAPPRSKKAKAQTLSRNMEIVRIKSESIDKDAHLIASGMVQLLAQDFRPYRSVGTKDNDQQHHDNDSNASQPDPDRSASSDSTPSPAAGPGFRSKSPEEERIFDRIEQALLVRRVVQRQPQLAQLAASSIDASQVPLPSVHRQSNNTSEHEAPRHESAKSPSEADQEPGASEPRQNEAAPRLQHDALMRATDTDSTDDDMGNTRETTTSESASTSASVDRWVDLERETETETETERSQEQHH